MADNVTVSNAPTSSNPDIPVRSVEKGGEQSQVVVIDYGGAGTEDLSVPDFATQATLQQIANSTASGAASTDILGVTSVGARTNQVELAFDTAFDTDVISNSATGGASATISNGHALYASGTSTTAQVSGVSVQTVKYRPGNEQYVYFTAAFTTPTSANRVQRIGLFDANNGFFIGYEGLTFGATKRSGGSDTQVAYASFNGDPLDGSASSNFKRAGTPEAIDFTKSNLFRSRWAWLGSAPVQYEVFSPDGSWVVFHTLRFPNLQLNPSIESPNLPITIQVTKTSADATNLILYTACVAGGTTTNLEKLTTALTDDTLAALNRSVIAGRSSTGGGTYYNVKVTPSGSLLTAIGDIGDVAGQETMANSLPVVIASDQSAVPITDNGGSITVDGTVAATQSGTWNINNISGTVSLPTGAATEATLSTLNTKVNNTGASAQQVQGNTAAGAALAGNVMPIASKELLSGLQKQPTLFETGGVVYQVALTPDASFNFVSYTASGEQYVFPASTNNTKANARYLTVDTSGHLYTKTQSLNTALTAINTTYDNVTTTATSANIDCSGYKEAAVSFTLTKANAPTDITFEVECSLDGTNYAKHTNGPLSSWVYDDTAVGASGISRCLVFPICYAFVRVFVLATGTTATNTFTIANANLYLRN